MAVQTLEKIRSYSPPISSEGNGRVVGSPVLELSRDQIDNVSSLLHSAGLGAIIDADEKPIDVAQLKAITLRVKEKSSMDQWSVPVILILPTKDSLPPLSDCPIEVNTSGVDVYIKCKLKIQGISHATLDFSYYGAIETVTYYAANSRYGDREGFVQVHDQKYMTLKTYNEDYPRTPELIIATLGCRYDHPSHVGVFNLYSDS